MIELSSSKKGARSELIACIWLINSGYEVFRGVHSDGFADIVAYRTGNFILIDVKTLSINNNRIPYHQPLKTNQIEKGVRLLTVHPVTGKCTLYDHGISKSFESHTHEKRVMASMKGAQTRMRN